LSGFGVIKPRGGQKLDFEIKRGVVNMLEFWLPVGAKGGKKIFPGVKGDFEFFEKVGSVNFFDKQRKGSVMLMQETVKFVPFNLKGDKDIDQIINIRDRRNKIS